MEQITPERGYGRNDMVRTDCKDCDGCSSCCENMGDSIVLDPYDLYLLYHTYGKDFSELLAEEYIELSVKQGLILPNIKMKSKQMCCGFLNEEGRCKIHDARPGICRLFPLGRQYVDGRIEYFLLPEACPKEPKGKVKVKKWLGMPDIAAYEKFLVEWHDFRKEIEYAVTNLSEEQIKILDMFVLKQIFERNYEEDFFAYFSERIGIVRQTLGME